MGVIKHFSSGAYDNNKDWDKNFAVNLSNKAPFIRVERVTETVISTPDPSKYDVMKIKQVGDCTMLTLRYHEATNYEGNKTLVFRGTTYDELLKTNGGVIDPHFSTNTGMISPFARFEPTDDGWQMAFRLCNLLNN
tara:strand:- start:7085 stop:7492 length:408 start_codon:yes stop_codon:yes gene_type:complete